MFIYLTVIYLLHIHVNVGPCNHVIGHPQVVDEGDIIWRVAVGILNTQSWTNENGSSSSLQGV